MSNAKRRHRRRYRRARANRWIRATDAAFADSPWIRGLMRSLIANAKLKPCCSCGVKWPNHCMMVMKPVKNKSMKRGRLVEMGVTRLQRHLEKWCFCTNCYISKAAELGVRLVVRVTAESTAHTGWGAGREE